MAKHKTVLLVFSIDPDDWGDIETEHIELEPELERSLHEYSVKYNASEKQLHARIRKIMKHFKLKSCSITYSVINEKGESIRIKDIDFINPFIKPKSKTKSK